jgi:alkylhydroperoxidase family enzyme
MTRIPPLDPNDPLTPEQRAAYDHGIDRYGRMTNMKRTLLHSLPAFRALMEWYPLRDTVQPFLGERLTTIFSHAISADTDCLICSTFFRRILMDSGENPDDLSLDDRDQLVIDFGRALAAPLSRVPDDLYARLATHFTDEQIVALTAFGAMMLATNVVNNALDIPLDDYLEPYTKPSTAHPEGTRRTSESPPSSPGLSHPGESTERADPGKPTHP